MERSCLSQLIEHIDHVNNLLEQGKSSDVIYLDFVKGLDKVDFEVTLCYTKNLGFQGKLGRWIHFSWMIMSKLSQLKRKSQSPSLWSLECHKDQS